MSGAPVTAWLWVQIGIVLKHYSDILSLSWRNYRRYMSQVSSRIAFQSLQASAHGSIPDGVTVRINVFLPKGPCHGTTNPFCLLNNAIDLSMETTMKIHSCCVKFVFAGYYSCTNRLLFYWQWIGTTDGFSSIQLTTQHTFIYLSCSARTGVRYSATFNVSTATPMVATPSAGVPSYVCLATLSLTVM